MAERKQIRDSKMEILRILSMVFIIMGHFAYHGHYYPGFTASTFNRIVINFFIVGMNIGVNCFIVLSGYFLINGKFGWKKFFRVVFEVFFYSALIYICFLIAGAIPYDFKDLLMNFFPVFFSRYWFATTYVIIYLLFPFTNKLIKSLSMKQNMILIGFLIFFHSIFCFFNQNYFSNVGWFVTLYMIGAYIRLYKNKWLTSKWTNIWIFAFSCLTIFLFEAVLNYSVYYKNYIPCVLASISLFNLFAFSKWHCTNRFTNIIASTTFGIYLIHDNIFIRNFLWRTLLNCPEMANKSYFVFYAIASVVGVFVVCCAIDLLRQHLVENPVEKLCNRLIKNRQKFKN